jgi:hypothetical protein
MMMMMIEDYHSEPLLLEDPSTGTFILEKHFKMDTLPSQSSATRNCQPFVHICWAQQYYGLETFWTVNDLIVVQHDGRQQVRVAR